LHWKTAKNNFTACGKEVFSLRDDAMSEMEEDQILENADEELHDLEEKPKSFLVLVAVILGALSLILSLICIVQDNQGSGTINEIGATTQIDGSVGADDIRTRLDDLATKVANLETSTSGFNADISSGLGDEVAKLKAEVAALRANSTSVRNPTSQTPSTPPAATPQTPSTTPVTPKPGTATIPPNGIVHTIQRGETLSGLSKKYGVPLEKINAANTGLDPNRIQIGQKIVIPGKN
jgi:LysM repeat protein